MDDALAVSGRAGSGPREPAGAVKDAAFLVRRPDDRLVVVVLSDHEGAPVRKIAEGLERAAAER